MKKNYFKVISDGTADSTKVSLPDGYTVDLAFININMAVNEPEIVTMLFYPSAYLFARFDGTAAGNGLFMRDGSQIDGIIEICPDIYNKDSAKFMIGVKFYPYGSMFAREEKQNE